MAEKTATGAEAAAIAAAIARFQSEFAAGHRNKTSLGLDLRFQDDLSPMLAKLAVGPRTVGNRWCIHPMEGCDGELDGAPGELTFRRYHRFASGGRRSRR